MIGRKKRIEYWVFLVIKSRFPCLGSIPGKDEAGWINSPILPEKIRKKNRNRVFGRIYWYYPIQRYVKFCRAYN